MLSVEDDWLKDLQISLLSILIKKNQLNICITYFNGACYRNRFQRENKNSQGYSILYVLYIDVIYHIFECTNNWIV